MPDPVIQVDHVWKKFRMGEINDSLRELIPALMRRLLGKRPKSADLQAKEFWALKDISFEVHRGQSLGIIGPNGAGKSTMLKLLSRILRPNRGSYKVNGRLSALIEVGAGFHQDLTGRENIYLNGTILGMTRKEVKEREEAIIEFADLARFIDTPVKRYSSGMNARLGFSVAAHLRPDVLLVDEVLSVGDARFRQKCLNHMRDLAKSDCTVVFISHILDQVRSLCPRTIVLNAGEVAYDGPSDGAIRKYLEILDSAGPQSSEDHNAGAEVTDVRVCDSDGREVLAWTAGQPGMLEFEVVLRRPFKDFALLLNFESLGGPYVGTATSALQGLVPGPTKPGRYTMQYLMDPMPLAEGDFSVAIQIHEGPGQQQFVWTARHPRTLSVRGGNPGGLINCHGNWRFFAETPTTDDASPQRDAVAAGHR